MRLFGPVKVNDTIQVEIEVLDTKPVPARAAASCATASGSRTSVAKQSWNTMWPLDSRPAGKGK